MEIQSITEVRYNPICVLVRVIQKGIYVISVRHQPEATALICRRMDPDSMLYRDACVINPMDKQDRVINAANGGFRVEFVQLNPM